MKRIITLLFVVLVTIPVYGQLKGQNKHKYHNQIPDRIINIRTTDYNRITEFYTQNLRDNYIKKQKLLKSATLYNKTLDSLISEEWDDDFNEWRAETKEEFTYNSIGNIETEIISYWNHQYSDWQPFIKFEYEINFESNLSSIIGYFQFAPNQWNLSDKYEYTYDENGNLTSEISYFWNNGWVQSYKYIIEYNTSKQITLQMHYEWNQGTNQWDYMNKNEFFYSSGLLSSEITSYWNYGTNDWEYNSKWEYFYEMMGVTEEILYRWETNPSGFWVKESKYEYQYGMGNLSLLVRTNETDYIWHEGVNGWDWKPIYKTDYEYDVRPRRHGKK